MLYCNFDKIITGLYQQTNTNMHIKRLFDCDKLYKHITTSTANDDNEFKIKENHLFFFWSNFGQSIVGHKKYSIIRQSRDVFSDVASVSDEAFGIFTLKRCWDSWMSAMNNTETPGTATVKYKHTEHRSNIKYRGWDADGLKEFSVIATLIKSQRSQQYRQQIEENYKNHVETKLNRKYGIITPTPSKNTDSYVAYNDLPSDEDEPVSTEQNQSIIANHNIAESDSNQHDMLNDNIETQMNAPTQQMINDDGELANIYIYIFMHI